MYAAARGRARLAIAGAALLLFAACGSSSTSSSSSTTSGSPSSSSPGSSSSSRTPEQLDADRQTAQSLLLKLDDFPAGWKSKPRSASSSSDTPEAIAATKKFANCLGIDESFVGEASDPTKARAKSDQFTMGDLEVEESATVHETVHDQETILTAFRKPTAPACFQEFMNTAFEFALSHPDPGKELPPGTEVGKVEVSESDVTGLHGDPIVYRTTIPFTVQGQTFEIIDDFVFGLKGRTSLELTFQNVGAPFPTDLVVQLANTAIDRAPGS